MSDYRLISEANGGLTLVESGTDYVLTIDPSNLQAQATPTTADTVIIFSGDATIKKATLANLSKGINATNITTGALNHDYVDDYIPVKDEDFTITGDWIFSPTNNELKLQKTSAEVSVGLRRQLAAAGAVAKIEGRDYSDNIYGRIEFTSVTFGSQGKIVLNAYGTSINKGLTIQGATDADYNQIGFNVAPVSGVTVEIGSANATANYLRITGAAVPAGLRVYDGTNQWAFGVDSADGYFKLALGAALTASTSAIKFSKTLPYDATFSGRITAPGLSVTKYHKFAPTQKMVSGSITSFSAAEISSGFITVSVTSNSTMSDSNAIPDGVDGQLLYVFNYGPANLIFKDGDFYNVRLYGYNSGADVTLTPSQSILFVFSNAVGTWQRVQFS